MAYTIKVGNTNKKINDTGHSYTLIGTHEVWLKRPCSIDKPVFTLKTSAGFDTLSRCNYLEWLSDLTTPVNGSSYYWIDNITFVANNLIEISCHRDPFATFKSNITSYEGLVARCSTGYDISIFDQELLCSSKQKKINFAWEDVRLGPYTNQQSGDTGIAFQQGSISATWQTIGKSGSKLFNIQDTVNNTMDDLLNRSGEWEFGLTNPGQYIASCFLLPFKSSAYTDYDDIPLGNLDATLTSPHNNIDPASIASSNQELSFVFTPADHYGPTKQGYPEGDFRNYTEKFTKVKVWAPFVGSIDIPSIHLKANKIVGDYKVSFANGLGKFVLRAVYERPADHTIHEVVLMTSNVNMSIDVPVAMGHQSGQAVAQTVSTAIATGAEVIGSAVSMGAAIAAGGAAGAATAAQIGGKTTSDVIANGTKICADWASGFQEYTCLGSSGSLAELDGDFVEAGICIQTMDTVTEAVNHEKGRPVMQYRQIGTTSCFIVMYAPSLNIAGATPAEVSEINAALASGVYIR